MQSTLMFLIVTETKPLHQRDGTPYLALIFVICSMLYINVFLLSLVTILKQELSVVNEKLKIC
jgi:hypothetical protein